MTSTLFTFAPAGVLGSGSVDARPYAYAALLPMTTGVVAGVDGTGLPVSVPVTATPPQFRGRVAEATSALAASGVRQHTDLIAQNDGTTLGNHSPGRPQS
jgi:hypothetical protein